MDLTRYKDGQEICCLSPELAELSSNDSKQTVIERRTAEKFLTAAMDAAMSALEEQTRVALERHQKLWQAVYDAYGITKEQAQTHSFALKPTEDGGWVLILRQHKGADVESVGVEH